jgi:hypothetical protein
VWWKEKKTLNAQAITKLLPVLIVLQWVSAFGVVQNYQKIDIAITSDRTKYSIGSGAW